MEEAGGRRKGGNRLTLGAVLRMNKPEPIPVTRTLLDIIRSEAPRTAAYLATSVLQSTSDNRVRLSDALAAEREEESEAVQPARVSLMDLLDDADRQLGWRMEAEEDRVTEHPQFNCCVCMVRHKGAAFIPCGHTFCRLCSRELWVSRGNCPLCNASILEILDIF